MGAAVAAVCAVGLGAAACSAVPTATLNRASVQDTIATWLAERYDLPRPAVACPSGVAGRAGTHFRCAATIAGTRVVVDGTVADTSGHFDVALDEAVIDSARTSRLLAHKLQTPGEPAPVVTCGPKGIHVVAPGRTFTCTASQDGVNTIVVGTPSGSRGEVSFTIGAADPVNSAPATPPFTAPVPTTITSTVPSTTTTTVAPTTTTLPPIPATTVPATTVPTTTVPTTTAPTTTAPTTTVPSNTLPSNTLPTNTLPSTTLP